MRLSLFTTLLTVGLATPSAAVAAVAIDLATQSSAVADNKIPGDSPLMLCSRNNENHNHDSLTIQRVDISPNPPQPYVVRKKTKHGGWCW